MLTLASSFMPTVIGAFKWNPTVRGFLFPIIMFVILGGSSYLIMATNVGNRLGFLLANAGLWGWIFLMSLTWILYGIGMTGRANAWHVKEHLVGSTAAAQYEPVADLKKGWKLVEEGTPARGDAQSVVDAYLAPPAESGRRGLFSTTSDYLSLADAYERGGDNELFTLRKHKFFFRHSPHYFVIQVQPTVKVKEGDKEINKLVDGKPVRDENAPITSVVMLRDLGSKRQPGFVLMLCSGILFAVSCYSLHKRDKAVMAAVKNNPALARA